MLKSIDAFFSHWLGPATDVGATSWLQAFTWVATVVAALIAGMALRRNSLQNRATILFNLYKSWEGLAEQRKKFTAFYELTRRKIMSEHHAKREQDQVEEMRREFKTKLNSLRAADDPIFTEFVLYICFFEMLGLYTKNGYLPLRDVMQAYEGPLLAVNIAWRDFVAAWEKEPHVPPGLLEHAVFLANAAQIKTSHPLVYQVACQFPETFQRITKALA